MVFLKQYFFFLLGIFVLSGVFAFGNVSFAASCTFNDSSTGKSYSGECRSNAAGCGTNELSKDDSTGACSAAGVGLWDCCVPNTTTFYCGTGGEGTCKDACASGDTAVSGSDSQCASLTVTKGKCCKAASSTGASCSGKDSSGATQSGTCSTTATCSSGTALTSATGCSSGMACCYASPPGSSCDMSKCSTTSCSQGTNNSFCAAECKSHYGTSGEYYYCETTQGGSGTYCSGSQNAGIVPCGRSCDDPTTPNDEMAICTLCHLFLLLQNITSWIFMVMTYIAFAVLVAMGILYIVSAGNTQMIGLAKSGIKAALYGFAIVLLGWVAINVILMVLADGALGTDTATFSFKTNGSWFTYSCDAKSKYVRTGVTGATSGGGTPTGSGGNLNCKDGKCAKMQDVANAAKSNASGVEADIVMAIVDAGEGCNKSLSSDGYGSCGYSQALPAIRAKCGITGSVSESCTKIQNNVQLDMNCAAWLIKDNAARCGMDIRNVASCYNSGKPNNCAKTTNRYCDRVETYYKSCKS